MSIPQVPDPSQTEPNRSSAAKLTRTLPEIGRAISQFIQEIDSLAETLPLAMRSIGAAQKTAHQRIEQFIEEHRLQRDAERKAVTVPAEHILRFESLARRFGRIRVAGTLVPRSFLVNLISQYDAFLGSLIRAILLKRPELLNASEKALSFAELLTFGSVEAARNHIIEKEVETVLRKSHVEQFDWLENKFNIKLRQGLPAWPRFVELTERRNLYVHVGGRVSSQYLQVCKAHSVDCLDAKAGSVLQVSPGYFRQAYETVFEIGVKLGHVLWRKLIPDELEAGDIHLTSVTYDLLVERKYELAKTLLDFATDVLKRYASDDRRLRFVVNRVQAYKWSGDMTRARAILDAEDFSALSDVFKLADAVLRDNFPVAIDLVKRIGRSDQMPITFYRDWPLFQELRKQPAFEEIIVEIFGEPLNKVSVQPVIDAELMPRVPPAKEGGLTEPAPEPDSGP